MAKHHRSTHARIPLPLVECLDTLDRIQALTYTLTQLAKVEDHCTLHSLAVQILATIVSQECKGLREVVRPK